MAQDNINYGVATPKVELLSGLPHVLQYASSHQFDVRAESWPTFYNSPFLSPLLTEYVADPVGGLYACHPSKRQYFINNYIDGGVSDSPPLERTGPYVLWNPVGLGGTETWEHIQQLVNRDKNPYLRYDSKGSMEPVILTDGTLCYPSDYDGPQWKNIPFQDQPQPDDNTTIKNFYNLIGGSEESAESSTSEDEKWWITPNQAKTKEGLWWGLESNDFITENMPFWITLSRDPLPPPSKVYETKFIISLGMGSSDNADRYDIIISLNAKPILIDYYGIDKSTGDGNPTIREFQYDSSKILSKETQVNIGIMTICGRLILNINDDVLTYTRVIKSGRDEDKGKLKEAKIRKGGVRVYGTNISASVMAYPMTFAPLSIISFPIPTKAREDVGGETKEVDIIYSAMSYDGSPTGLPVTILPKATTEGADLNYGIDCRVFEDINGIVETQESFGYHREGSAKFFSAPNLNESLANLPSTNFFYISMIPEDREWDEETIIPYAKAPYFLRLKGTYETPKAVGAFTSKDITDDLISVSEEASAPDYFHIKKSATITLYNENGTYDYLRDSQKGIRISWGWNGNRWNGNRRQTFTGLIINTQTSEVAGKETITLMCEDYMYILQNIPIINSPFYDGMLAYFAIADLARRAGFNSDSFERDWEFATEYFLPSGYSFSNPKVRFKSVDKIFDCMMSIVKRFEAYIYFDGEGKLHIDKLQGGLFSVQTPRPSTKFVSSPEKAGILIIEERNIEYDLNSTVNHISILTLDRDTRNPIIYARAATGQENRLLFKKKMLIDQPAYGELSVAKAYARELTYRVFKPIRKARFKTIGNQGIIDPLDFILVDGVIFRLMSLSRQYDANSNDFNQSYEAEWLGG